MFESILETKLTVLVEKELDDSQNGFSEEHSVQDHISTTKQIMEKTKAGVKKYTWISWVSKSV